MPASRAIRAWIKSDYGGGCHSLTICGVLERATTEGLLAGYYLKGGVAKRFSDVMDNAKAKGRVSVRRSLFRMAAKDNVAAAIFLSKNLLGYRDVVNTEHSGLAGGPIQIAARPDFSQLTDEELKQLHVIADKTLPPGRN